MRAFQQIHIASIMRSSACKYVLDKVSKFEKKYAKPVQRQNEREDSSSENVENEITGVKTKSISHVHVRQEANHKKSEILQGCSSFESGIMSTSKVNLPMNSFQMTCKADENERVTAILKGKSKKSSLTNNKQHKEGGINRKMDLNSLSDDESRLTEDIEYHHNIGDTNELLVNKFDQDLRIYAEDTLEENFIPIEDKKIKSNVLRTPFSVDTHEEGFKKQRLQVSLNLKLDEDPDEISDITSEGIASLSLENSNSSQFTPPRIFAFEDLIAEEELKSNNEESKNNLKEQSKLDARSSAAKGNDSKSYVSMDNKEIVGTLIKTSEGEYLQEYNKSIDESSIKEDIEEIIESSIGESCNDFSEKIHISSEKIVLSLELHVNKHKNALVSDSSENVAKSVQFKDSHSSDESIADFACEMHIVTESSQESESDLQKERHKDTMAIKFNPKESCDKETHSDQDLKLIPDKKIRNRQKDTKHVKYVKQSHHKEKYVDSKLKLLGKSKNVFQGKLFHVSTQTENYLAETYDFEKRMEAILKSSFNTMTDVNSLPIEVNNVHGEASHSESALSPLERGFNCALKQQVELTKHFIHAEFNMYAVCMAAIKEMAATYQPATLKYSKRVTNNQSHKKSIQRK